MPTRLRPAKPLVHIKPVSQMSMETDRLRFEKYVEHTETCWLWTGAGNPAGYGQFRIRRVQRGAHCWAWEWANGPIPTGMQIHHVCRTPRCVNPAHLELSTRRRNLQQRRYNSWAELASTLATHEQPLTVTLTPEQSAWVRFRASEASTSVDDVIERALHSYMATWRWAKANAQSRE
jgi:hypothetical protein